MVGYFNNNVKKLRIIHNLSQTSLADKIGVDRSVLSRIENDQIDTSLSNAVKIANYFKIPLNVLIYSNVDDIKKFNEDYSYYNNLYERFFELDENGKKKVLDIIDVINK